MSVFGVDYAWGRPGPGALKRVGTAFVCRYLSRDTTGKNLSRGEAEELSAAGLWLVVVWESSATRALQGKAAGVTDAREAASQAKACGMPDDRPIYFAVDWDANSSQQDEINAYLDGAASVLGRDRVGLYAGYGPIKRAFDAGKITYGWQTYAWSGGRWDSRAQIQQYSNDHTINGVGLDYDRAVKSDYGQWRVGVSPKEDDVPLTEKDAETLLQTDGIVDNPVGDKNNPKVRTAWILTDTNQQIRKAITMLAAMSQQAPDVDEDAIVQGLLAALTPESIAAAVVAALPAELASQVVDEIQSRLAS